VGKGDGVAPHDVRNSFFYIISGRASIEVDGPARSARPARACMSPPKEHQFRNAGDHHGRVPSRSSPPTGGDRKNVV